LKSHADFKHTQKDGIALLKLIQQLTSTFEERRNLVDALDGIGT